ncbi:MAG: zinc-binding dehydrogenase [Deltaproteobacteria bacterium]|nr:zinc-binding dehydrogenase [Deltaproteobacteria bacterium]
MRAVVLREHGGVDVLQEEEIETPHAGPGEVRVRVHACALNRLDLWVRAGLPGLRLAYPHRLGSDVAGVVDEVGPGAPDSLAGSRVLVNPGLSCGRCRECLRGDDNLCASYRILGEHVSGGYAEWVTIPVQNVLPYPEGLGWEQAAAVPLVFLTAWQMLVRRARVRPGDWVVVHAAGSGVGSAAIQIAKLFGATVVATASSPAKLEQARALGADHVSSYDQLVDVVRRLTGKRGVDVVVEHTGKATWESSLRVLRWGGTLVTCGATSGHEAQTDLRHVFYRQLSILGSTMGSKADLHDLLPHVASGRLRPVVDRTYPLSEARQAHLRLESREQFGKVVLLP